MISSDMVMILLLIGILAMVSEANIYMVLHLALNILDDGNCKDIG